MAEPLAHLLTGIRAVADPSRLRLLAICAQGEWTVSELVQVMGQSQPRISRHLKVLAEAGLLDRFREGGWVFYRRAQGGEGARIARSLCRLLPDDDPALRARPPAAGRRARGPAPAGRTLLRRPRRGLGQRARSRRRRRPGRGRAAASVRDRAARQPARRRHRHRPSSCSCSPAMSASGSASISATTCWPWPAPTWTSARRATARSGRATCTSCRCPTRSFAAVTLHQVLHFADDPLAVLTEAARVLGPGGRLVVVDLLNHEQERLRTVKAHRRLGFGDGRDVGLVP